MTKTDEEILKTEFEMFPQFIEGLDIFWKQKFLRCMKLAREEVLSKLNEYKCVYCPNRQGEGGFAICGVCYINQIKESLPDNLLLQANRRRDELNQAKHEIQKLKEELASYKFGLTCETCKSTESYCGPCSEDRFNELKEKNKKLRDALDDYEYWHAYFCAYCNQFEEEQKDCPYVESRKKALETEGKE